MVFTESSKSRVQALFQLMKSGEDSSINKLLNAEDSSEEIIRSTIKSVFSDDFKDWSKHLRTKPVYKSMKSIVAGEFITNANAAKVISSLLTQMFIRAERSPDFPLKALGASELSEILLRFTSTQEFDTNKVKELINNILAYLEVSDD